LALVLPLLGLAATWGFTHVRAQQGTEWDVPIGGYDPRDLLRGHYVVYSYDWPGLEGSEALRFESELCIHGTAPAIERVSREAGADCPNPVRADPYGEDRSSGLAAGRLYVSQEQGAQLEKQLADPGLQGMVRFRLRDDGRITPLRITFRPRPAEAETSDPFKVEDPDKE
jgi:hypothetical protein